MKVLKFGGSSVANATNMEKVVRIVNEYSNTDTIVLVVSAMAGVTDGLLQAGHLASQGDDTYRSVLSELEHKHYQAIRDLLPLQQQSAVLSKVKQHFNELEGVCDGVYLLKEISLRTKDRIVSYGELLSSLIMAARFQQEGVDFCWTDSRELIVTDDNYTRATLDTATTRERIQAFFQATPHRLYVAPGFIATSHAGYTTTLGRGGSDYTAAIYAALLQASVLEIWTDVSGMMTADPRLVPHAQPIECISYQEAMELSHFGAKIIYPPTIQPVMDKNIPVWIKNTFEPQAKGTRIEGHTTVSDSFIRGISSISSIALLSLEGSGMVGIPGFSKRLFEALANEQVNVILITQSSSEHSICVGVNEADTLRAKKAVDHAFTHEIQTGKLEPLIVETGLSVVALVGDRMKSHPGVSGRMFGTLGRNGINVRAIAQGSSERNISTVIASRDVRKAINVLHEIFFETTYKQLNLFIAGVGNVGRRLLAQIQQQQQYLQREMNIQLRVVGIANSKRMLVHEQGLDLKDAEHLLASGEPADIHAFVAQIQEKNLRNSVFVDVTASHAVASIYGTLLERSISVVACNKIACSSDHATYQALKGKAKSYNALFLYETNVGAGLPIIGTLSDLIRSGDQVVRIQAVLSGTLNFVFNEYDGSIPFAEVVRKAQSEGYTEPDPRLDLGGTDVMRKIMILAREAGAALEMEAIGNQQFLPAVCLEGTVEDFYQAMAEQEPHFLSLYQAAAKEGAKLKFVARFEEGKASVGLEHIQPDSDLYHLYGKDNLVLFHTHRYPVQPLVIKGAGAGAEVTASGVFADIIRVARI